MGVLDDIVDTINEVTSPVMDLIVTYWWILIVIPIGLFIYFVLRALGVF